MIVDVPVQVVEAPSVQNHVFVVPAANWQDSTRRPADPFVLAEDPQAYHVLEWEDVPADPVAADEALGARDGAGVASAKDAAKVTASRHAKVAKPKKRAVIRKVRKTDKPSDCTGKAQ